MFVRAKTIKGKKYGYLVENVWKNGKVKQRTKKYLGKIIPTTPSSNPQEEIDFSLSIKEIMIQLVSRELQAHGFSKHPKRNALILDDIEVHFPSTSIKQGGKNAVLLLNDRYLFPSLLQDLVSFFRPESSEEKPGTKLASLLSDAGVSISGDEFVQLYKKIYLA